MKYIGIGLMWLGGAAAIAAVSFGISDSEVINVSIFCVAVSFCIATIVVADSDNG